MSQGIKNFLYYRNDMLAEMETQTLIFFHLFLPASKPARIISKIAQACSKGCMLAVSFSRESCAIQI